MLNLLSYYPSNNEMLDDLKMMVYLSNLIHTHDKYI